MSENVLDRLNAAARCRYRQDYMGSGKERERERERERENRG